MEAEITTAELTMLECLREFASDAGDRVSQDPKSIARRLRISPEQFAVNAASLAAHGLAGMRVMQTGLDQAVSTKCSAIWLTKAGEAYLSRVRPARSVKRFARGDDE